MKRLLTFIIIIVILLIAAGAAYWYYLFYTPAHTVSVTTNPGSGTGGGGGFVPISRNPSPTGAPANPGGNSNASTTLPGQKPGAPAKIPLLRQLSSVPVGGYGVMTSGTTTAIRWVDRGRGNIYEVKEGAPTTQTLSNTLVPRIYQSWWNKDITTFTAQYLTDTSDTVTTVIAALVKNTPTTSTKKSGTSLASTTTTVSNQVSETPFELKGKVVSGSVIASAVSPAKDRILFVNNENGRAVGYTAKFDGTGQSQIFSLPFTQINVDWPEANTVAVSTNGSAAYPGFLYLINVNTGSMKEVLGNIPGLRAIVSRDLSKVFFSASAAGTTKITDSILDLASGKTTAVIFRSLADTCVWGNKFKQNLYCAIPSTVPDGIYPDDWYSGVSTFIDNIWKLDASTGQAKQISRLLQDGNASIDASRLQISPADDYLFFINKNDLSLWSLDLASTN